LISIVKQESKEMVKLRDDCTIKLYFIDTLLDELKKNIDKGTKLKPTLILRGTLHVIDHWFDDNAKSIAFREFESGDLCIWIKPDENNSFLDEVFHKRKEGVKNVDNSL